MLDIQVHGVSLLVTTKNCVKMGLVLFHQTISAIQGIGKTPEILDFPGFVVFSFVNSLDNKIIV